MNPTALQFPKISIIIPCYNTANFITATLDAVFQQDFKNIEVIVVNDGSTDNTLEILQNSPYIFELLNNKNQGVSTSRNQGMSIATGEYILFLDADDLLPPHFLSSRLQLLIEEQTDVSCGYVFDYIDEKRTRKRIAYSFDIVEAILDFNQEINTCPSSYLIRLDRLRENGLKFNRHLSSPADKFFILQLCNAQFRFSFVEDESAALLYRIHEKSMSNFLSLSLINDARAYFYLLRTDFNFPTKTKRRITVSKGFLIVSGSYFKMRKFKLAIKYGCGALYYHPMTVFRFFKNKLIQ